jgi:hypothetical protein
VQTGEFSICSEKNTGDNIAKYSINHLPHYMKSGAKTMLGDKVILSENKIQRELIREFEEDFDTVMKRTDDEFAEEKRIQSDPNRETYARECLRAFRAEFFDKLYYEPLADIFSKRLGYTPGRQRINQLS